MKPDRRLTMEIDKELPGFVGQLRGDAGDGPMLLARIQLAVMTVVLGLAVQALLR